MTTGRAPRLPRTERGGGEVPPDVAPNAVEDGGSEQCEATTDDAQAQPYYPRGGHIVSFA